MPVLHLQSTDNSFNSKVIIKFLNHSEIKNRTIRSYVKRESRLTKAQELALEKYWDKHGIDFNNKLIDLYSLFNRHAPIIMDIGVGTGDTTFHHAKTHPENNYLAIEVHKPGIGRLLNNIESKQLNNIKIINYDVVEVLQYQIPDRCLSQVFIFFPDPWPKKKHHKRRLINTKFLDLLKKKITLNGRLHIATDWKNYADHIYELCTNDKDLLNINSNNKTVPRPDWRSQTRYETRGLRLDNEVWDFCYALNKPD